MDLSIIVVNYRTWSDLEKSLASLSDGFPRSWEIVVVDNCSDDGRLDEFARQHPTVKFVANSANAGFARGCNLGAQHARGEQLLFLNPDVIATSSALADLLEVKKANPDVTILTCRQVDSRGRGQKSFDMFPDLLTYFGTVRALLRFVRPSKYPDSRVRLDGLTYCDWVTGAVLMIGREDFARLNGWCEEFWMYSEDVDLCRRARDAGGRVAMTPAVELIHHHGTASRSTKRVAVVTKIEAIISKHVYNSRHARGLRRWCNAAILASKNLLRLGVMTLASFLFLGQSTKLNQCRQIFFGLVSYYARVVTKGNWLSERAAALAQADVSGEISRG